MQKMYYHISTNAQFMKKRNNSIDTVAGIMILYMIFMHCCQFTNMMDCKFMQFMQIVFVGFMAWFFFKSGMYHHQEQNAKHILEKTCPKLLRPYIVFSIIGWPIYCISLLSRNDTTWWHYLLTPCKNVLLSGSYGGALPLWFLITLLLVKVISPIILNKFKHKGWIICGFIGWFLYRINENYLTIYPIYIMNFFPAMFFYGFGYFLKERQFNKCILFVSIIIFMVSFIYPSILDFRTNKISDGLYPLYILYSMSSIVVFNNVFKNINRSITHIFTLIGKQSMYWYCAHWPILIIINLLTKTYFPFLESIQLLLISFTLVITILCLIRPLVYNTNLKYIIGL